MERTLWDLAIIGGGAAGLAAGVMAARKRLRSVILEKQPRVGRKLLATGNGTCNITNRGAEPRRYHGVRPDFVRPALDKFSPADTCAFFASIGVECAAREDGRVYPVCAQASAVLDCLRLELAACGVEEWCGCAVISIKQGENGFHLDTTVGELYARQVLVCAGGAAAPGLGGGNDGYTLLAGFGHDRTPLFPSIVQVKTDTAWVRSLKGVRVEGAVSFRLDGRECGQEEGEILFTEYGLSGPAVMQISRCVGDWERQKRGRMEAVLDLLPGYDEEWVRRQLAVRRELPGRTMENLLTGLLQKRLGQTVLRAVGCLPLSRPAASLMDKELAGVAACIKGWVIPVTGTQGFGGAQVTAGGMNTALFDPDTLESTLVPGLYAAGEVLDVDGDCGGFNLQWAWASAHAAVAAIAEKGVSR